MNTTITRYTTTITIFLHWQGVSIYIDILFKTNYEIHKNTFENIFTQNGIKMILSNILVYDKRESIALQLIGLYLVN